MLQKIIQRLSFFFSYITYDVVKKFKIMDKYEKLIIVWSLSVFCMVLFTPLLVVSSNDIIDQWLQYIFLIANISLWKSFLLIEWSIAFSLLWLFHNKFKVYIVENLWFQWNNYLFLCLLYLISTSTFISIGEIVNLFSSYTMIITLTPLYYIGFILLILLLATCIYLSFYTWNKRFKWHVVGYHGKKERQEIESDWSLFDDIHHDE